MSQAPSVQNIHGRQGRRGIRPYLLIPKYVFVSVFLGGLVSMLVLGFFMPWPTTANDWHHREMLLKNAYVWVIVPGLLGGMLMGLILLFQNFRVFMRMRWMQVKLAVVVVGVPCLHFHMRGKALALHAALTRGTPEDLSRATLLWGDLRNGTLAAIAFALVVIVLGRIKPRLGQNYARTFGTAGKSPAGFTASNDM